jgi:hypothetical protein
MFSSDLPRVSGIYIARTETVPNARNPKRKYAPNADLARKIGVKIATSQFVTCSSILETVSKVRW